MQQIKSFGILQTAKFAGVLYVVMTAIFAIPSGIVGALVAVIAGKPEGLISLLFIVLPIFYGIFGFLMVALMCWLYNVVAARMGGVEIELQ